VSWQQICKTRTKSYPGQGLRGGNSICTAGERGEMRKVLFPSPSTQAKVKQSVTLRSDGGRGGKRDFLLSSLATHAQKAVTFQHFLSHLPGFFWVLKPILIFSSKVENPFNHNSFPLSPEAFNYPQNFRLHFPDLPADFETKTTSPLKI
jgi:hypothetical protein